MPTITYAYATTTPLAIPPLHRPLCADATELGYCWHASCQALDADGRLHLAEGPLCAHADYVGECPHPTCLAIEPAQGDCTTHGWQLVTTAGSGPGFAGGRVYWASLACGCTDMDESGDAEAAR